MIVPFTAPVTLAAEETQGNRIPLFPVPNSKEILEFGVTLSESVLMDDLPIATCENAKAEKSKKLDIIIFFFIFKYF
jgi:hypothetical protein